MLLLHSALVAPKIRLFIKTENFTLCIVYKFTRFIE